MFRFVFTSLWVTIKLFVATMSVITAVLSGNYLGDKLRALITQRPGHQLEFVHRDERGNTYIAANLLLSNFLPGLLLGLMLRPRWVFSFLGGMVASFIMNDQYEDRLWDNLDEILSGGDPARAWNYPDLPPRLQP